jgi:two-component system, NtrC family, response regulator AtoC
VIKVLCIDDQWDGEGLEGLFAGVFRELGIDVAFESNGAEGMASVCRDPAIDLVLLDLKLPDSPDQGMAILQELKEVRPSLPVIILSGLGDAVVAEQCCADLGAVLYFVKGEFTPKQLAICIRNAVIGTRKAREADSLRALVTDERLSAELVGGSDSIRRLRKQILEVASSPGTTVLITGDRGVGKDLVAQAIHRGIRDPTSHPFVRILCSSIPESLFESELFGVIPNYPGFHSPEGLTGKFREGDRGTVFLDEIGDMPLRIQSKLLEVLERKSFRPIGGSRDVSIDARIVAATNQDLDQLTQERRFRADLLDRIRVYGIHIPPLRERKEDITDIAWCFLRRFNSELGRNVEDIDVAALDKLMEHDWPGNVRELRNCIERAFVNSSLEKGRVLTAAHLGQLEPVRDKSSSTLESRLVDSFLEEIYSGKRQLSSVPREYQSKVIREVLKREEGVGTQAAQILGVSATAFRRKLSNLGISTLSFRPGHNQKDR